MKTIFLFAALFVYSLQVNAFIHTYMFIKPDYGMGGELAVYTCTQNPVTYSITYNGAPLSFSSFPLAMQSGLNTLDFTATDQTNGSIYHFVALINFTAMTPSISYSILPSVEPLSVIETFIPPTMICDGTVDLVMSGGYPPVNLNWIQPTGTFGNPVLNACPGVYEYSIADNYGFCNPGTPLTRTIQLDPFFCTIAASDASCPGVCDADASLIPITGANPIMMSVIFDQNNSSINDPFTLTGLCGNTGLVGNIYHASGQQAFCFATIVEPVALSFTIDTTSTSAPGISDGAASVTVTSGGTPYTYQWSGPNGFDASGMASISALEAGSYTLSIGFNNGQCDSVYTFDILSSGVNGLDEMNGNALQLFPVPTKDVLYLKSALTGILEFDIYDASGRLLKNQKMDVNTGNIEINVLDLTEGHYTLHLYSNEGISQQSFVIVR